MSRKSEDRRNIYRRGRIWWARLTINGTERRRSLRTDDEAVALRRAKEGREREIAHAHFGDHRVTDQEAVTAWGEHIASNVGPNTAKRYAVSLGQLEPILRPLFLDEIDGRLVAEIVRQRRGAGVS